MASASRLEAIASRLEASLLGWWPALLPEDLARLVADEDGDGTFESENFKLKHDRPGLAT